MKKAYATVLCHGDGYLPGVEVLGKSIDASGSQVPKVVLVTEDIGAEARAADTARLADCCGRAHRESCARSTALSSF
ncbi:MAG TPA: hypothetical protein VFN67_25990 [Polyangiales bacterium]|nr:hypothetical protein [Polyangiales bacterium]